MDVHVRPAEIAAGARSAPTSPRADAAHVLGHRRSARSGQYGWKAPHHWSGASEMSRSMRSTNHAGRSVRGLGLATLAGLTLSTLPMSVSASPAVVQAPLLAQAVVGLRQGATGAEVIALQK